MGYLGICGVLLLVALVIAIVSLLCINSFTSEGYYNWYPGFYPGYWGYQVPVWKRRWWWRRRRWGYPLSGYYQPYYYY